MGIISTLFGGSNSADKAIDFVTSSVKGVGNYIDEQKFTEEEKSVANAKAAALMLDMIKITRNENSVQSITRRYLAWGIMGTYTLLLLLAVAVHPVSVEYSDFIFQVLTESHIGELSIGVGTFYFLAGVMRARK